MSVYTNNAHYSHDIIMHHLLKPEFIDPLTKWFMLKYIHSEAISETFTERQKYIIRAMLNRDDIRHIINSLSPTEYSRHYVRKMYERYISSIADDIYDHINYMGLPKNKSL